MARFVRNYLRNDFLTADVGVTGCNFAVAESGSVSIVANEGNARLVTTIPKTLITVMGDGTDCPNMGGAGCVSNTPVPKFCRAKINELYYRLNGTWRDRWT